MAFCLINNNMDSARDGPARASLSWQSMILLQNWTKASRQTAILLDLSKIPHERLAVKLRKFGIQGNILQWIQRLLRDTSHQVRIEGQASLVHPFLWSTGVSKEQFLDHYSFFFCHFTRMTCHRVSSIARLFPGDSLLYLKIPSSRYSRAAEGSEQAPTVAIGPADII